MMARKSSATANSTEILRILNHAGLTVFSQDADLRYRWIENPPLSWRPPTTGQTDGDVLPPTAAAIAVAIKREVLSTGRPQWTDLVVEGGGTTSYFDLYLEPERADDGAITGVRGLALDVTDRREQAAALEAIARDSSHRSKNLLAIIQSLATQTAQAASSPEAFVEQFRGRIQSISRSQDLSIGANRHGAHLSDLVETQVVPYLINASKQVEFKGVDCHLSPNAALHVGLALYELCISAVQSGPLSAPSGKVLVTSELIDAPAPGIGQPLQMTWRESGGPHGPDAAGFGKVLLERLVPASVGGAAQLATTGDGRRYDLTIAATEFE